MKNENGLILLNNNIKEHKAFDLFYNDAIFARYEYDNELKRYQSYVGYLDIEDVYEIAKNKNDTRRIVWDK